MLTSAAKGTDVNSGIAVTSLQVNSNNVLIQGAAVLTSSISASPPIVGVGFTITVIMTVTNSGGATANNVLPSALTIGGPLETPIGALPTAQNILGNSSAEFTWTDSRRQ